MENLHVEIEKLSGSEAKSLLVNILYRIEFLKQEAGSQSYTVTELLELSQEVRQELQKEKKFEGANKAVHLICGESSAGSLRIGLHYENKIIGFPDFFTVGPLWDLHTEEGRVKRYDWLVNNINYDMDYLEEEYCNRISKTIDQINAIPSSLPIILWTATNSDEQIALRYFLYLLREKKNCMYVINTTKAFQAIYSTKSPQVDLRHSGEVAPEQFEEIYTTKLGEPLTAEKRRELENEWLLLSKQRGNLRVIEKETIQNVHDDYFDSLIIDFVQELHSQYGKTDFILTAKVIGEILFRSPHLINDGYLEYRIRCLVLKGLFEIKGIPKSMRHYSVRLSS
ncbi:hypothetical protein GPDM_01775 [Planococcus donghaensis MPA1U2]|uniref:DUF1835 domain-containing protein n=1 Tax=Planococcus donghaensis MPA1U2 TaxID=933115 RepID=E7RD27_9BACL|nr:DUF1835 domain-containing protein [Planococcus donghaensis]EGA91091.1 hypothetical protein GPDM_01775 [Planococcus donghaensis MPA1U2]